VKANRVQYVAQAQNFCSKQLLRRISKFDGKCIEKRHAQFSSYHSFYSLGRAIFVGGLPLPKVLKNVINHMFSAQYRLSQEVSAPG
jgi:hypothetical protein